MIVHVKNEKEYNYIIEKNKFHDHWKDRFDVYSKNCPEGLVINIPDKSYAGLKYFMSKKLTVISFEEYLEKTNSKELTELPINWYIEVENEEQQKVYRDFFNKVKPSNAWVFDIKYKYGYYDNKYFSGSSSCTKITFEQFKKWVLKEETVKVIPSFYITYSKDFTEDLFNKFFEWAKINIGPYIRNDVPISYKNFKSVYKYIWVSLDEGYKYSQDNNRQTIKHQYSIEDLEGLIGYVKEETKSLVGRYLKALVDSPNGGGVKRGEIGIITGIWFDGTPHYVDFPNQKGYGVSPDTYKDGKSYELMPEGFKPEDSTTVKFEVGKWYKSKDNFYLKPIKIEGDYSLQGADYITDKGKYVFNASGRDNLNNWEQLTDLSEIQKYLPDDHVDKVVEEKWIPKVGDWVVSLETESPLITKGKAYKLKKVDRVGLWHDCDDGSFNGYSQYKYRKAEPHEIPNSKESLLEEAKRRYPVGTKFKSLLSKYCINTVRNGVFIEKGTSDIIDYSETSGNYIYYKGKWAEIVSTPNPINPKTLDSVKPIVSCDSHSYSNSNSNKKLEIYIEPIKPREVEPIVELKIKKVSKLTI